MNPYDNTGCITQCKCPNEDNNADITALYVTGNNETIKRFVDDENCDDNNDISICTETRLKREVLGDDGNICAKTRLLQEQKEGVTRTKLQQKPIPDHDICTETRIRGFIKSLNIKEVEDCMEKYAQSVKVKPDTGNCAKRQQIKKKLCTKCKKKGRPVKDCDKCAALDKEKEKLKKKEEKKLKKNKKDKDTKDPKDPVGPTCPRTKVKCDEDKKDTCPDENPCCNARPEVKEKLPDICGETRKTREKVVRGEFFQCWKIVAIGFGAFFLLGFILAGFGTLFL